MLILLILSIIASVVGSLYIHSNQIRHNHHYPLQLKELIEEHEASKNLPWQMNIIDGDAIEKYHSEYDGLLHLPGGCQLTSEQYQKMRDFQRNTHYVQNCYCHDEEVYCKLKQGGQHVQIT